jgi:hypothetical protein
LKKKETGFFPNDIKLSISALDNADFGMVILCKSKT